MKAALLGDIHGNLPALEAVLDHARQQGVEAIWNIGDFVGYGPFPDEVVQLMRRVEAVSIAGNYDLKVLRLPEKENKWRESKRPEKFLAFKWAYEHLSDSSLEYLRSLPKEIRLEAAGKRILLTHGSPASNVEPVTPLTLRPRLQELAKLAQADIVICGHSHQPFNRHVDGVWFINTGTVGRPDDGDPRAGYAVLTLNGSLSEVKYYRIEYNVERVADAIYHYGLPESYAQMFLRGRDLDGVVE